MFLSIVNMRVLSVNSILFLSMINVGCTAMAVVGTAASVGGAAISVTATAVKTTGKVAGAIVDAAIPDEDDKQ